MESAPLRVIRDGYPDEPGLDIAVSRALLLRASQGEVPETFRLNRTGRVVAFGKRDTLTGSYHTAAAEARRRGYDAVERLAGGRAAAFHEGTLAFSWAIPDPAPRERITARFEELSALVVRALARLGVVAGVGELPGEYCPGKYSVHIGGSIKVMGVGQRLARRAAHVGGVVVVTGSRQLRSILDPVYRALGLQWRPETAGAVEDAVPSMGIEDVASAVLAELSDRRALLVERTDDSTLALARELAPQHRSPLPSGLRPVG